MFTWIIATEATRQTSNVVRMPAALPCSLRSNPMTKAAATVNANRSATSPHVSDVVMPVIAAVAASTP
jgi:hypothetical protein